MARKPRAEIEITADDKTSVGFSKATNNLKVFASRIGSLASTAGTAIAGVAAAVGYVGTKLFQSAADSLEIRNKFKAVFQESSDAVSAFGDEFGKMAGLTRAETEAMLSNIGGITKGLGLSTEAAADLTEQVATLAGDLASFNNLESADAAERITKALLGEAEGMKALGIVVQDTVVKQRALQETGKKTTAALTQQEIAMARLHEIYAQAQRQGAIGDLAATQDSLANTARRVTAQFRELWQQLALNLIPVFEAALPLVESFVSWMTTTGLPTITTWIQKLTDILGITSAIKRMIEENTKYYQNKAKEMTDDELANETKLLAVRRERLEQERQLAEAITDAADINEILAAAGRSDVPFSQRKAEADSLLSWAQEFLGIRQGLLGGMAQDEKRAYEFLKKQLELEEQAYEVERERRTLMGSTTGTSTETVEVPKVSPREIDVEGIDNIPIPTEKLDFIGEAPEIPEPMIGDMPMTEWWAEFLRAFEWPDLTPDWFTEALEPINELANSVGNLDEQLHRMAVNTLINFGDAWVEAWEAIGGGENVLEMIGKAAKRALADAATVEAQTQAAKGIAKLAEGIWPPNPAAFASAAQHFAAAAAFGAIAGAVGGSRSASAGGGVGSRPPLSDDSLERVRLANERAATTIYIEGGLLDMSDPRQAQALKEAWEDTSGRRVIIAGS